jgi:hypothetical protein
MAIWKLGPRLPFYPFDRFNDLVPLTARAISRLPDCSRRLLVALCITSRAISFEPGIVAAANRSRGLSANPSRTASSVCFRNEVCCAFSRYIFPFFNPTHLSNVEI